MIKSFLKIAVGIFLIIFVLNLNRVNGTNSSFSDMELSASNSFTAGVWGEDTEIKPGDVIINEVMWMGSYNSNGSKNAGDEWIELKNMTGHDIDLSNWDIENGGSGGGHIEIPNGYKIKANDYFLITAEKWDETLINLSSDLANDEGLTHVAGMNLLNSGEKLTLEDKDNNIIDTAGENDSDWPAGCDDKSGICPEKRHSMERNNNYNTGWHTCTDSACNDTTYWDIEGSNYGTPGHANLSANDSSAKTSKENQEQKDEESGRGAGQGAEETLVGGPEEPVINPEELIPEESGLSDNPEIGAEEETSTESESDLSQN